MKNNKITLDNIKKLLTSRTIFIQFAIIFLLLVSTFIIGQTPPHPGDESLGGGSASNPIGGGAAPIDGGIITFIIMSVAYGIKKFHIQLRERE